MIAGTRLVSGLWPPFAGAVQYLISAAEYLGMDAQIISGYRSWDEQTALYAIGRTPAEIAHRVAKHGTGGAVTDAWAGQSPHNYGLAIDVDNPAVRNLAAEIGFGTVSWDLPHIEWPGWRHLLR
jgi:LAS superfamily LD-carboxypeptidase LdcB